LKGHGAILDVFNSKNMDMGGVETPAVKKIVSDLFIHAAEFLAAQGTQLDTTASCC